MNIYICTYIHVYIFIHMYRTSPYPVHFRGGGVSDSLGRAAHSHTLAHTHSLKLSPSPIRTRCPPQAGIAKTLGFMCRAMVGGPHRPLLPSLPAKAEAAGGAAWGVEEGGTLSRTLLLTLPTLSHALTVCVSHPHTI